MSEPMPGAVPAQQEADADPARAAAATAPAGQAASADRVATTGQAEAAEPAPAAGPHPHGLSDAAEHVDAEEPTQPVDPEDEDQDQDEDDGPRPLGLHVEPTGHAPVDVQLRRLEDADHLAVSGHLEVYEDVHRGLREHLAGLDRHPASAPATGPASASAPGPGRPVPGPQPHRS